MTALIRVGLLDGGKPNQMQNNFHPSSEKSMCQLKLKKSVLMTFWNGLMEKIQMKKNMKKNLKEKNFICSDWVAATESRNQVFVNEEELFSFNNFFFLYLNKFKSPGSNNTVSWHYNKSSDYSSLLVPPIRMRERLQMTNQRPWKIRTTLLTCTCFFYKSLQGILFMWSFN